MHDGDRLSTPFTEMPCTPHINGRTRTWFAEATPQSHTSLCARPAIFRLSTLLLLILHCVAFTFPAFPQPSRFFEEWRWIEFTTESGLPSNHVYAIVETERGTPWVFTKLGVAWYDDFIWHQVPFPARPPFSKPYSFYADSHDRIILVHDSTLYVGDTSGFQRVNISHVIHAVPIPDGSLMVLRDHFGKPRLDFCPHDFVGKTEADLIPLVLPSNHFASRVGLCRTQSKTIWLAADDCFFEWQEGKWIQRLCAAFNSSSLQEGLAENESKSGILLTAGRGDSLSGWEWSKGSEPVRRSRLISPKTLDIAPNGTVIVTDVSGTFFIRWKDQWSEVRLQHLSARLVEMLRFRKSGDLWLCTERGLHLFKYTAERWRLLAQTDVSRRNVGALINDIVLASDSSLWYGTGDGLTVRQHDGNTIALRHILGQRIRTVTGVIEDRERNILICSGSVFKGVFRWNHYSWERISVGTPVEHAYIHRMRTDRRGRTWFLGITGPHTAVEKEGPGAFLYENGTITKWNLPGNRVYAFEEGPDSSLWFGTLAGLSRWKSGTWRHWSRNELFSAAKVFTLAIDREGQVWFADSKSVVGVLHRNGALRRLTTEDGLPDEQIWEIKVDDKGRVWCTTQAGLAVYCNGVWTRFDESWGLPNTVLWPVLPLAKEVYVGSNNGLLALSLAGLEDAAPRVFLDQVLTSESTALLRWKAIACWGEIPSRDILTRYRVNTQPWSQWSNKRESQMQDLAPGKYVYEVQSRPLLGVDSSRFETARSTFTITIPLAKDPRVMIPVTVVVIIIAALVIGFTTHARRLKQAQLREELRREHEHAERLAQVDKLKSRFFANISHEFRTPLTLILGPIEKLKQSLNPEERSDEGSGCQTTDNILRLRSATAQDVKMMERNAHRLLRLINQLLDFSKVEAGSMKLALAQGDIVAFTRRIVQSFQSWAEQKRIRLCFNADEEKIEGWFDQDTVEKILNNLLSNAMKFTPEGGMVQIALTPIPSPTGRGERGVRVVVSDSGVGIAPEHLPHIFERFYRADESHKTEGTGIGLALTKELVELHHGTIAVESIVGSGTMFTVDLPVNKETFAQDEIIGIDETAKQRSRETENREIAPSTDAPIRPFPDSASRKDNSQSHLAPPQESAPLILIVEDNADLRAYVRSYLLAEFSVLESENGADGLEKARETIPDLVVSDIMMPLMDGYELCQALKTDERTSHIPVILLTARAATKDRIEGLDIGADDYVTKPFDARELLARMRNLIEGRRRLREKFGKTVPLKPGEVAVTSLDDAFLQKAIAVVEKRIGNPDFGVDEFCYEMALGRTQIYRKLHALTNQSVVEFIRHIRLMRAHELILKGAGTISDIAYQTGFGSLTYFTRCYRERFSCTPSETRSSQKTGPHASSQG